MAIDDRTSPLDLALGPPDSPRRRALERLFGGGRPEKPEAPSPASPPASPPPGAEGKAIPVPVDERSTLDRARSEQLRDHRSVLPALVEARRKLHGEAIALLDYLKELQGKLLAHEGLAREWETRAAAALARDDGDGGGLARYAVKKRLHHVREAKAASARTGEIAASLQKLLESTVDLDARIETAAHLERRIALAKGVADAKAGLVNALHDAEAAGGPSGALARLSETALLAEAESEMGDELLGMEFADGAAAVERRFEERDVDEEIRRLAGPDGKRLIR